MKERQKFYYDHHVKDLPPIHPDDLIKLRLPGQVRWTVGVCTKVAGPRSYEVKVGNTTYRRNRRQLIPLKASIQRGSPDQIEVLPQPIRQAEIVNPSSTADLSPQYLDTPNNVTLTVAHQTTQCLIQLTITL